MLYALCAVAALGVLVALGGQAELRAPALPGLLELLLRLLVDVRAQVRVELLLP